MLYDIVLHPDDRLRRVADPIVRIDGRIQTMARDMIETMLHDDHAVGLAAPQVGILERLLVCDARDGFGPRVLINPTITASSERTSKYQEGCLSIPDVYAEVTRPAEITVTFTDERGEPRELTTDGFLSTLIQHEIDHLDGKLFIDYLSPLKREMVLKKYFKLLKIKE